MLNRLNDDTFEQRKTCTIRLHGNKMQIDAVISSAEDIIKLIKEYSNVCNIYSMQITIADEEYNVRTGFPTHTINKATKKFLVADKITTLREIAQEKPNTELTPTVLQQEDLSVPAIKTYSLTRDAVAVNKWSGKRAVTTKETQAWRKLNKDTDIVVNSELKQIFPTKTGKKPTSLVELLQHVR